MCVMMAEPLKGRDIVLVVDDNPETLSLLIEAIESAGMTALVARDGDTALTLVGRIQPDIVLLDAVMPGMSGFEACRRLKSRPAVAAVPVIFMTGLSESDHVLEGLRAGGVDYLTKPINPDELVARIAIHIANARMVEDARHALDATGQSILALRNDGSLSWASPVPHSPLKRHLRARWRKLSRASPPSGCGSSRCAPALCRKPRSSRSASLATGA
jgi:CheY-like chemotaxis protein